MSEKNQKVPFLYRNYVRWPLMIGMILVVVLGLIYIFVVDPEKSPGATMPCLTHEYFGVYCPGCGDTRALHALVHGNILKAFDYNLLFPFAALVLGWYFLVALTSLFFRKRVMWIPESLPIWGTVSILSVVFLFTVLRNVPVWPFTVLAP